MDKGVIILLIACLVLLQLVDAVVASGSYYSVLGVKPTATLDEIKKAYRTMALKVITLVWFEFNLMSLV